MIFRTVFIFQVVVLAVVSNAWAKDFFGILDYRPSTFLEEPTAPFFYSIKDKLRFGTVITDDGPVLFAPNPKDKGIRAVYVSPNEQKAAVVSGGNLYLVQPDQQPRRILSDVYDLIGASGESMRGPTGKRVYDHHTIQWDPGSRFLYVSSGIWSNGYPSHMALVRIDVFSPSDTIEVTNDAHMGPYFLIGSEAVCFRRSVNRGDLVLKCVHNGTEQSPVAIEANRIVMQEGPPLEGRPFASYRWSRGEIWLLRAGFAIRAHESAWGFFSKERPSESIFRFNGAVEPLKGHYGDGIVETGSNVLPGDRYALLKLRMENFKGRDQEILVDGLTGQYRELPRNTVVYRNLNSLDYQNVIFGLNWYDNPKFAPAQSLRPYTP